MVEESSESILPSLATSHAPEMWFVSMFAVLELDKRLETALMALLLGLDLLTAFTDRLYQQTSGMCPLHCRMMYDYGY